MTAAHVTFVGNATTILRLGAFTLLTDPAFGHAGSRVYLGYGAWTRRVKEPALPDQRELAGLDGILLSHLHGDHFDRAARRALPGDLPIITTEQAARKLKTRTTVGLPTWETHEWARDGQRLRVTSVPGQHGPGLADKLLPDVMGSLVELLVDEQAVVRLYITGDTLYRPFLTEVSRRLGDVDVMLIHLGGTRLMGLLLTMDAAQGVALTQLVRPALTLPIHYDDYAVFKSPLTDYLSRCRDQELPGVQPVARGQTVPIPLRETR
jgi:L-ascorbate metabolism protein UlaG (beta-lactamase superfamily)